MGMIPLPYTPGILSKSMRTASRFVTPPANPNRPKPSTHRAYSESGYLSSPTTATRRMTPTISTTNVTMLLTFPFSKKPGSGAAYLMHCSSIDDSDMPPGAPVAVSTSLDEPASDSTSPTSRLSTASNLRMRAFVSAVAPERTMPRVTKELAASTSTVTFRVQLPSLLSLGDTSLRTTVTNLSPFGTSNARERSTKRTAPLRPTSCAVASHVTRVTPIGLFALYVMVRSFVEAESDDLRHSAHPVFSTMPTALANRDALPSASSSRASSKLAATVAAGARTSASSTVVPSNGSPVDTASL